MTRSRRLLAAVGVTVAIGAIVAGAAFVLLRTSPLWGAMGMFDDARRAESFRSMGTIFPAHRVAAAGEPWPFTVAERALPPAYSFLGDERSVEAFLEATETTGLLVALDGVIVHESYRRGYDADSRIASFSVAKAFVATLVGIAVERGHIGSIDDALESYVPELAQGGYAGVTIRQALGMTSGVEFDESYDDPSSDVMGLPIQVYGLRRSVPAVASRLERARPPGASRAYASSDSLVLGAVVSNAVGVPLASFLEEALWQPTGMEADAAWNVDLHGNALAHAFLNATLRDYARFGRLVLHGGARDGRQVVPAAWIDASQQPTDVPRVDAGPRPFGADFDLGYGWWLPDAAEVVAMGIYGQFVYVHQGLGVVIVKTSTDAGFAGREAESIEVFRAIARSLTSE